MICSHLWENKRQMHIQVEFQFSELLLAIIEFFVFIIGTLAFSALWKMKNFKWSVQRAPTPTLKSLKTKFKAWIHEVEQWSWRYRGVGKCLIGKFDMKLESSGRSCRSTAEVKKFQLNLVRKLWLKLERSIKIGKFSWTW